MELNHLREFIVLAQTENFLEAAEIMFIAQSTLSKHIKSIERELGVSLFNRTTRKVELSRYGRMLLPHAKKIIEIQNTYSSELLGSLTREQNSLDVGSIPALAPYSITDVLVAFHREFPAVALNVVQEGSDQLKNRLRKGELELAFVRETEIHRDEFVRLPFERDELVAVLPDVHPDAGQERIALSKLREEKFLMVDVQSMLYDLSCEACRRSGFEPRVVFTDHRIDALVEFVRKGMGVALMMRNLATYARPHGVSVVSLTPTVGTHVNLLYRRERELSAAGQHFLRCTKQVRQALTAKAVAE